MPESRYHGYPLGVHAVDSDSRVLVNVREVLGEACYDPLACSLFALVVRRDTVIEVEENCVRVRPRCLGKRVEIVTGNDPVATVSLRIDWHNSPVPPEEFYIFMPISSVVERLCT